ncbi:MAG TPA: PorV/PorQ family protein [Ignavibacteriales bacterium]|nr:PorV/PorQ family protein [Ignavibacteriales bacterium]
MNFKIKDKLMVLIGLLIFSVPSSAQIMKKAQVGMKFLSNPVSAEVIGRGTAGINSTFNSNGIFWNPALTSMIPGKVDLSLNYHQWIADISYNAVAASFNAFDFGVVTLSGTIVNYGDLVATRRSLSSAGYDETGTFSPSAYTLGLGFSQKVSDRFSYGVNLKYVNQELGSAWVTDKMDSMDAKKSSIKLKDYGLGAVAIDIGTYYDFQYKGITFAATLSNVSREMKYENEAFPLPFAVSFGFTVSPLQFAFQNLQGHDLVLMFESNHPRDFGEKLKYAAEYSYEKTFFLRGGYVTHSDQRGFSAGLGFRKAISNVPFRIDYAFQPFGIFGNLHNFTVGISY